MAAEVSVEGHVAPGFDGVREAFEDNFRVRGDVGASVAVYVDGSPVVDLWGGVADPVTGRAWGPDTTTTVYSATKGATAILVHALAEAGVLDLDAPVAPPTGRSSPRAARPASRCACCSPTRRACRCPPRR
ncbi:serine hydrolase [Geodermatophilus sp. SYSU D01186]